VTAIVVTLGVEPVAGSFPGWHIAGSGTCWRAVRGGLQAWHGPASLLRRVLWAPDLVTPAEKLSSQDHPGNLPAGGLAGVREKAVLP
jgi:hypothetical protein